MRSTVSPSTMFVTVRAGSAEPGRRGRISRDDFRDVGRGRLIVAAEAGAPHPPLGEVCHRFSNLSSHCSGFSLGGRAALSTAHRDDGAVPRLTVYPALRQPCSPRRLSPQRQCSLPGRLRPSTGGNAMSSYPESHRDRAGDRHRMRTRPRRCQRAGTGIVRAGETASWLRSPPSVACMANCARRGGKGPTTRRSCRCATTRSPVDSGVR
jgi:hypothetical protein